MDKEQELLGEIGVLKRALFRIVWAHNHVPNMGDNTQDEVIDKIKEQIEMVVKGQKYSGEPEFQDFSTSELVFKSIFDYDKLTKGEKDGNDDA
jgi:hypothetical protein